MAMIACKECKKEVSSEANVCPHCGISLKRKPFGFGGAIAFIFLAFVLVAVFNSINNSVSSQSVSVVTPAQPPASVKPIVCDRDDARKVMANFQKMARESENNGIWRVQWKDDFHSWGTDRQLQVARAYADVDACIFGSARELRFYSPGGRLNAVASPTSGVRLMN